MKDKEFLTWLYYRLRDKYDEDVNSDYMLKLSSIIDSMEEKTLTPNISFPLGSTSCNVL